jgi:hypothetical protein
MLNIIMPVLISIGLYMSSSGDIEGNFLLMAVLSFHIFMVTLVSAIILAGSHTVVIPNGSASVNLMLQIMYGLAAYQLFAMGYTIIVGMAAITLAISFLANAGNYFYGNDEEDLDEEDE